MFSQTINKVIEDHIDADLLNNVLLSDGQLSAAQFNLQQAIELRDAGPWGQGFPAPLFDGHFKLQQQRLVAGKHLKMVLELDGHAIDAIAFNVDLDVWPNAMIKKVYCAYRLDVNEFRGEKTVQLLVELLQVAS